MKSFDEILSYRLKKLEESLPDEPSTKRRQPVRLSLATTGAIAAVALLAGVVVGSGPLSGVHGSDGLFNPGQPLQCTRIQQMSPTEASAILANMGYIVTWQVEDQDAGTSKQTQRVPADGYIIDGVVQGKMMVLVVERGENASPVPPQAC